ncbi:MAG: ATP-binding protein [Thermomicrobiaceae bacterium]
MSVVEASSVLTQGVFLCVAIYVVYATIQRPTRSNLHVLAFFLLLALIIAYTWVQRLLDVIPVPVSERITPILILTLPYLLLTLAQQFSSVEQRHMRAAGAAMLGSILVAEVLGTDNLLILLGIVGYFSATTGFAAYRFYEGSKSANGITRKRLRAIAMGTVALSAALALVVGVTVTDGLIGTMIELVRQVLLLFSAVLYLIGFATPSVLRQAWQEPELRQFLRQTLTLPRWASEHDALRHIEASCAETVGAPYAAIGLWNPETELIEFRYNKFKPGETIGGRAFSENRPIMSLDTVTDDPASREVYERGQAFAVMAAPIITSDETIGVISLYSPNPPIFAEDDLALLQLLSDQVAVLLQNRRHIDAQAELAAREESTRLKDEFLSVAAHDLKTPLTTILATGQYLERRLSAQGDESPELRSVIRLNREATRLRAFVQGLLDASRIEQGKLLSSLEKVDISHLVSDVVERAAVTGSHRIDVNISDELVSEVDQVRVQQVIENLLENAQKYSPPGSLISVRCWNDNDRVRVSITDSGPGIDAGDLERIFDRYFRSAQASNGDAPGIGLGLYICKAIVEQHGGAIWVESKLDVGSTFHVSLQRSEVPSLEQATVDTHR